MLIAAKYWSFVPQHFHYHLHFSTWRRLRSESTFRSKRLPPVAFSLDKKSAGFSSQEPRLRIPGGFHSTTSLQLTFPLFQAHGESSEAQRMPACKCWGKTGDTNGRAFPRGKDVCKILFKALTIRFWNENAALLVGRERFLSGLCTRT